MKNIILKKSHSKQKPKVRKPSAFVVYKGVIPNNRSWILWLRFYQKQLHYTIKNILKIKTQEDV